MPRLVDRFVQRTAPAKSPAPARASFEEFLLEDARVPLADGSFGRYTFEGRRPLQFIVRRIDAILRNTLDNQPVDVEYFVIEDGCTGVPPVSAPATGETPGQHRPRIVRKTHPFKPGALRKALVALCGGAQWGKSVLEQNFQAFLTACRFKNVATYIPDDLLLKTIVQTKFRPQVVNVIPWFAEMFSTVEKKPGRKRAENMNIFQVSDGRREAFGFYVSLNKPTTTITLDVAQLDERDDIKVENVGFVSARMTNSDVALQLDVGTQRIHGAGQNKVLMDGTQEVWIVECPHCHALHNLEDEFPGCYRVALDGTPQPTDPKITEELGHDREATYYLACTDCGTPVDADSGVPVARRADRIKEAKFSFRVSQLDIPAIRVHEVVGAWYAALIDPTGEALVAFYCDRIAIPRAGAAQPLTPEVLDRSRRLGLVAAADLDMRAGNAKRNFGYSMSLTPGAFPRVAGADMGPRCWFWADELVSPLLSACAWAEMISSGKFIERAGALLELLGITCLFMDAGGEPDLTKRAAITLNGLDNFAAPAVPRLELQKSTLANIGHGLTWDGSQARWYDVRAAAVLFVASEHKGIVQEVGFTEDGQIYPLIKCNRASVIQMAVNDFLTPHEGVTELSETGNHPDKTVAESRMRSGQPARAKAVRQLPRARLPDTYIGPGASQAIVDAHLLNLRKERDPRTGAEDWCDGVENHFGLAKVYARIAATLFAGPRPVSHCLNPDTAVTLGLRGGNPFARSIW